MKYEYNEISLFPLLRLLNETFNYYMYYCTNYINNILINPWWFPYLIWNSSVLVSQKYVNIIAFNSTHYMGLNHEITRHGACLTLSVSAEI